MNRDSAERESVAWIGSVDGHLRLIDQTQLPLELVYIDCTDIETIWEAITMLRVRGAPAIGMAAAYSVCIAIQEARDEADVIRPLESRRPIYGLQSSHGGQPVLGTGSHARPSRIPARPVAR